MKTYDPHPLALIFPDMEAAAFDALADDIRVNGLMEPVILHEDKILDGRHRFRACQELGIFCETQRFEGNDPAAYVVSHNLRRRHLSESQRAMVAAGLAKFKVGNPTGRNQHHRGISPIGGIPLTKETRQAAADALGVGTTSVDRARRVQRDGAPEVIAAVNGGNLTVSRAAEIVKLPKRDQAAAMNTNVSAEIEIPFEYSTKRINYKPSLGNELAIKALIQLKKIADNDTQVGPAFQLVIDYCKRRLAGRK